MKAMPIFVLVGLLSGCATFMETFAPETVAAQKAAIERERIDRYNGALYATLTPRADIKALLLSNDINQVRAGISAFRHTPEGEARFLVEVRETYGPLCAGAGLKDGTSEFAQCLIYRYEADMNRRQQAREAAAARTQRSQEAAAARAQRSRERAMDSMTTTTCRETIPGTVSCSSW